MEQFINFSELKANIIDNYAQFMRELQFTLSPNRLNRGRILP